MGDVVGVGTPAPVKRNNPGDFKPGNRVAVGNDGGDPTNRRTRRLTQMLIAELGEVDLVANANDPAAVRREVTKARRLIQKLISRAVDDGDMDAIKYIFDRVDGKMMQPLGMSDDDGAPYEFTIRLGHRGADGAEAVTEVRLRPTVAVPEAGSGDIQPAGLNGKTGALQRDRG